MCVCVGGGAGGEQVNNKRSNGITQAESLKPQQIACMYTDPDESRAVFGKAAPLGISAVKQRLPTAHFVAFFMLR